MFACIKYLVSYFLLLIVVLIGSIFLVFYYYLFFTGEFFDKYPIVLKLFSEELNFSCAEIVWFLHYFIVLFSQNKCFNVSLIVVCFSIYLKLMLYYYLRCPISVIRLF